MCEEIENWTQLELENFFKSVFNNYNNNEWTIFNRTSIFLILRAVQRLSK
jgi:hypothetical protein